jgi:hypothetical protein
MHKLLIPILALLFACARAPVSTVTVGKYNRKDWPHWTDRDHNCLDTRAEILKSRSLSPVQMNRRGCIVVSGKWKDYYYPETHTKAKKVDIDHLIPLKHAHLSGAHQWSKEKRELFANDSDNLVITNRSYNRKKGAKGIDEWLPVHQDYACKYINHWIRIKKKYRLTLNQAEMRTIELKRCP